MNKKCYTSLKEERVGLGLTRKELALEMSTTFETIRRIEEGMVIPSLFLAIKLADYFNKNVQDMFWE